MDKAHCFSKTDTLKVKGMAIILMVIHHCFMNKGRYEGQVVIFTPFTESQFNAAANAMKICVALFTFLSAYGMACSYGKKSIGEYSGKEIAILQIKRYFNLLSGYWFVFILLHLYSLIIGSGRYGEKYGYGVKSVIYLLIDFFGLGEVFSTPMFIATFWYIGMAHLIILAMPLLLYILDRFGPVALLGITLAFSVFFPVVETDMYANLPTYMFTVGMGIICAEYDLLGKISRLRINHNHMVNLCIKFGAMGGLVIITVFLRQAFAGSALLNLFNGIESTAIIAFMFLYINRIPVLSNVLQFLGVHSMNIFLIHNFIRIAWYYDFTYSFKYAGLIAGVLLGISLVVSIGIEMLKKWLRYDKMIASLRNRLIERTGSI